MSTIQKSNKIQFLIPSLLVYTILTFLTISAKYFSNDSLENIFKPLLMPTLLFIVVVNFKGNIAKEVKLLIFALVFSMLGDILLMPLFDNFILGLLSFLTGHFFYIILLSNLNSGDFITGLKKDKSKTLLLIFIYLALVLFLISSMNSKHVDLILIIAVVFYATIITLMTLNSLSLYNNIKQKKEAIILIGAILFMLSDSLIAINKFVTEIEFSGFYIMTTYCAAQFLIVLGVMKTLKKS